MRKVKIKICGVTNRHDAEKSTKFGANYIGLIHNLPKTNLSLKTKKIAEIIFKTHCKFIILTRETNATKLVNLLKKTNPYGVQLLLPTKNLIKAIKQNTKVKVISVIHVTDEKAIKKAKEFQSSDYLLLDSKVGKLLGGTGKTHDWNISRKIVKLSKIPVILAGGLNNKNIRKAIQKVKPYCVDIESSLRGKGNKRDLRKVKKIISLIKA